MLSHRERKRAVWQYGSVGKKARREKNPLRTLFLTFRTLHQPNNGLSDRSMAAAAIGELTGFIFQKPDYKILNNLTRLKVGYNKTTGLHFMSGRTEMGYEVG